MKVVNIVLKGSFGVSIDLGHLARSRDNVLYERKIFSGARWRELGLCILVFASGRFSLCGAKTMLGARETVYAYARCLNDIGYEATPRDLAVQTMTGSHDFGHVLPLEKLHDFLSPYADLTLELFPALIFKRNKKSATLFRNGKVNIAGGRSEDDLYDILNELMVAVALSTPDGNPQR